MYGQVTYAGSWIIGCVCKTGFVKFGYKLFNQYMEAERSIRVFGFLYWLTTIWLFISLRKAAKLLFDGLRRRFSPFIQCDIEIDFPKSGHIELHHHACMHSFCSNHACITTLKSMHIYIVYVYMGLQSCYDNFLYLKVWTHMLIKLLCVMHACMHDSSSACM